MRMVGAMKRVTITSVLVALSLTFGSAAHAACYADYKAKRDNPLRLHYGVVELPNAACRNKGRAAQLIQKRIAVGGWRLLNVMSFFGPEGLDQRKGSAGQFFLKF